MQKVIDEKQAKLDTLEKLLKKGKKAEFPSEKGMPKTIEQCKSHIEKIKQQIEKQEFNMKTKEDNKQVALGTSKINYMDPRITISWAKRKEMPIEKLFPDTLRKKFAWAMPVEPEYKF